MHTQKPKKGITVSAASEILGVSPATLRNWDRSGKLRAERDSDNGYRYYTVGDLERFADLHGLPKKSSRTFKLSA
mgnify:CR=1 FL=1